MLFMFFKKKTPKLHKTVFCIFTGLILVHVTAQKKVWKGAHQTDTSGNSQERAGDVAQVMLYPFKQRACFHVLCI